METQEWPSVAVDLERLRAERSVLIATPAFGGQTHAAYNLAVWSLETLLMQCGVAHNHIITFNDPYISYARNRLTQLFLESPYTDLLFIDADVEFDPRDVLGLLHFDKDVIGGAYSRKEIDWPTVKRVALEHPDIDPEHLSIVGGVFTTGRTDEDMRPMVPTKTPDLATGFMLIKRSTFERVAPLCQKYKTTQFDLPRRRTQETTVRSQYITDFFPSGVIGEEWVGDDYQFCRKVTEAGLEIYLCGWMEIAHHGTHRYPGNMHINLQYRQGAGGG